MAENLGKRPSKGILKNSSSFDNQEAPSRAVKETKWDEMNIIATLHPAEKDYGHMKIEEPKTPYNYEGMVDEEEEDQLDSREVTAKLEKSTKPKIFEESDEEDEDETEEERVRRKTFEAKRKGHYREWEAVQMARKKLLEDDEEDDEKDECQGDDTEETADEEVNEDEDTDRADNTDSKNSCSCVPSSSNDSNSQ